MHELVDLARLGAELPAIAHRHGARDVRGVVRPLAAGVDEEDLREEGLVLPLRERLLIRVVVRVDRAPGELAVVTAVVQGGGAVGGSHDGEVGLVDGAGQT